MIEPWTLILVLSAGLGLGSLIGWLAGTRRGREDAAVRGRLERELEERSRTESELREMLAQSRQSLARHQAELDHAGRSVDDKLAMLERAERTMREAFQSLSAEALRQNNQSFLDLARTSLGEFQKLARTELDSRQQAIGAMVRPVEETLRQVGSTLTDLERKREVAYEAIRSQVELMHATQEHLKKETATLVQALRTPSVRGQWGEIQLKRVIEMAGMVDHCDVVAQPTVSCETGRLRPDYVVRLPGGKNVVLDAKAPLAAYLEAIDCADDLTREARLKDHARQVREHMTRLGSKAYWEQFQPAPEFVVMFLPGEALFSAALQHDPALIEFGVDCQVIPASPTTLIALLRAVFYGWQQEKIAESAEEVRALGSELYDRLRVLAEHMEKLGGCLNGAVDAYNRAGGSLESRVLVSARRFRELAAGSSRDLPTLEPIELRARRVGDVEAGVPLTIPVLEPPLIEDDAN